MKNTSLLGFPLYLEKDGKGEDAEPILHQFEDKSILIGVFDGLGGAGSNTYKNENGNMVSEAYTASRLVKAFVEEYFINFIQRGVSKTDVGIIKELKEALKSKLKDAVKKLGTTTSKLTGTVLKHFPTTLAVLYFWRNEASHNVYKCFSVWAGDSRNYIMDESGLHQITRDDLSVDMDALDNLKNESPLSNCISADGDFVLNHFFNDNVTLPCIFISATDGCFSFLPTPMHFEFLLLEQLQKAKDMQEMEGNLLSEFRKACDDVSLSLVALGWSDFKDLKECFVEKYKEMSGYIEKYNSFEKEIMKYNEQIDELKQKKDAFTIKLWEAYKKGYERFERETIKE